MTAVSGFGALTSGTQVANRFSNYIGDQTIVITGTSPKSLGECLATTLARHRPRHLILASRTRSKLDAVAQHVFHETCFDCTVVELDLSSLSSIKDAADEIAAKVDKVDILINSAAVVSSERKETRDGIELQFGTNHVGHFYFTSLLMPLLLASKTPRVVNVSSAGYTVSPIRFHDYNFTGQPVPKEEQPPAEVPKKFTPDPEEGRNYHTFCAYGQSKTANILHAVSLNQKYGEAGLRAFAVHPGTINTDLSRNLIDEDWQAIVNHAKVWKTHDQGIATILVAALDPKIANEKTVREKGVFLRDCQFEDVASYAKDPEIADRLWVLSEELVRRGREDVEEGEEEVEEVGGKGSEVKL